VTTEITQAGITYAVNAKNNQGPKINITYAKIGPTQFPPGSSSPPIPNDPAIDIIDSVYTASPGQLQYAVVDQNTVEYILTLDESVGPFTIGRIGLFTEDGTLFSITMIDTKDGSGNYVPDNKFPTSGTVVGNRLTYSIYLAISSIATIANFTIQLLQLLTIPEVASELVLPGPTGVAFNTYQVDKHSFARIPAIGLRGLPSLGMSQAWLMASERLIPGQGEGVVPVDSSVFSSNAPVGKIVSVNYSGNPPQMVLADPQITNFMVGIRTGNEEITNYGMYVDPINNWSPLQLLYAGTGVNAGQIVGAANNWCIGYAIAPVNSSPPGSQPIQGWLCWIDFTGGLFARKSSGAGATGATGATGPGGTGGGGPGSGFQVGGQCYLELISGLLTLHPYNGNSIIIAGQIQTIPSAGVNLPPTGLLNDTNYYIYAFMTPTGMALQASTAGHITSQVTGVEIKNLDQNYTLVGFARTTAGPSPAAWIDTDGQLYVLSWFNRKRKRSRSQLASLCTNSANDYVEVSLTLRNYFLVWSNQVITFSTGGSHLGNGGNGVTSAISIDGLYPESENSTAAQGTRGPTMEGPIALAGTRKGLVEGWHYSTLMGFLSGGGPGKAQWRPYDYSNTHTQSNPLPSPITITMVVEG
jgi:hypothetical protein